MIDLEYTITKFDKENKLVVAVFADGGWAEVRLTNPLPKNITELEEIIKQFAPPKEAIEAKVAPDADLSYIDEVINKPRKCSRYVLRPEIPMIEEPVFDPELDAKLQAQEKAAFEAKVKALLVSLNVIPA